MNNAGFWEIIFQVVSSWQVIVITVFLVLLVFFVNYVTKISFARGPSTPKEKKTKGFKLKLKAPSLKKKEKKEAEDEEEVEGMDDSELGLEEE